MKEALIQRTITVLEDVITGLHEKKAEVRLWRKEWIGEVDRLTTEAHNGVDDKGHREWCLEQVEKASKFIRKGRKKIKQLEELQRALKSDLKGQQSIEAWVEMDDVEWRGLVKMAQQEDYQVTYSYDALIGDASGELY